METTQTKAFEKSWKLAQEYKVLPNFPLHLDIELCGYCNLQCKFCFQNGMITEPLGLMDIKLFKKIIDESALKNLQSIKLQVRGESFLHPQLFDCIRYAKDSGIPNVQITTNGTLLNDFMMIEILDSELDRITFSIDSQHPSIEDIVRKFLEYKKRFRKLRPRIRVHSVIPKTNPSLVEKARTLLKKKFPEVDAISITRLFNFRDDLNAYPDFKLNYKLLPCSFLMQRLTVFWNGDVTACCMDYNNKFGFGNMNSQSIKEIWSASKLNALRNVHRNDLRKTIPVCNHCHACTIPKHSVEFVPNLLW